MLKIYFGEWGDGRLQRLPYLGYHILLMVLVIAIIFGSIMAMGAMENMVGASIVQTQTMLLEKMGILGIIGIVILIFATILGQINILGKRLRDMGLPVLWTILGIIALSMILNVLFPPQEVTMAAASIQTADGSASAMAARSTTTSVVVQVFDMIVFLCLVLIPSDTFGAKKHD